MIWFGRQGLNFLFATMLTHAAVSDHDFTFNNHAIRDALCFIPLAMYYLFIAEFSHLSWIIMAVEEKTHRSLSQIIPDIIEYVFQSVCFATASSSALSSRCVLRKHAPLFPVYSSDSKYYQMRYKANKVGSDPALLPSCGTPTVGNLREEFAEHRNTFYRQLITHFIYWEKHAKKKASC